MALGAPRVLGLVLAGGRSTRFGSEKAVATVGGAPMIARVVSVLAGGCEAVAVSAPLGSGAADWAASAGLQVLPDPPGAPDGPLAGVLAGLEVAAASGFDWLLTAPCDTPWLPKTLALRLGARAGVGPVVVATTRDGVQPLCALWCVALRERLAIALAGGSHPSVGEWQRGVGAAEVRFSETRAFANLNTPRHLPSPLRSSIAALTGSAVAIGAPLIGLTASALLDPRLARCRIPLAACGVAPGANKLGSVLVVPSLSIGLGALAAYAVLRPALRPRG